MHRDPGSREGPFRLLTAGPRVNLQPSQPPYDYAVAGKTQRAQALMAYRLGELCEQRGDRARSIEYYSRFVTLWRDAGPALQPRVAEAKRRLASLAAEPRP
jgi:hypothetical protein